MDKDQEIEFLKTEVKRLRECVGSWRRLAQEKGPRGEFLKEGWRTDWGGEHYKVFVVQDIPTDLPITDVVQALREEFLPSVSPYRLRRIDYSKKFDGWLVQVEAPLQIDFEMEEKI